MKTTRFVLQTKHGVQQTFRFSQFSDNPTIGRAEAYQAAMRAQDAWERSMPEDQQQSLTIVEQ
jgi:hypothetical protein